MDLSWKGLKATKAVLRADRTTEIKLRAPRSQRIAKISSGGKAASFTAVGDQTIQLKMTAGKRYQITFD